MQCDGSEDHGLGCKATDLTEHTAWDRGLFADNEQFLLFCPHEFLPRCLRPPTLTVLSQTLHDASLPPKHTSRSPQSTGREKQQQRRPWRQDRCTPSDKHGASNEQTSGCEEAQYRVRSASSVNRRNRESDRIRGASTVSSKFPTSAAVSNGVQEERQSRVPAAPRTARTHQCRTPRRSSSLSNGARVHVIWDQHLATQSIRFIQCPELPKKPNTLIELEKFRHDTMKGGSVEFG